jgi:hypothetical protein
MVTHWDTRKEIFIHCGNYTLNYGFTRFYFIPQSKFFFKKIALSTN